MNNEITALELAKGLQGIYDGFTDAVRSMGSKANGKRRKSTLAQSALHWLAGSHIKTERDVLCDRFLQDVQKQLELMNEAMEGLPEEDAQEAIGKAVELLSQPVPEELNSTTALMKRAMLSQAVPYLSRLSGEQLQQLKERLEGAYKKSQRLPIEQEVLKTVDGLLT